MPLTRAWIQTYFMIYGMQRYVLHEFFCVSCHSSSPSDHLMRNSNSKPTLKLIHAMTGRKLERKEHFLNPAASASSSTGAYTIPSLTIEAPIPLSPPSISSPDLSRVSFPNTILNPLIETFTAATNTNTDSITSTSKSESTSTDSPTISSSETPFLTLLTLTPIMSSQSLHQPSSPWSPTIYNLSSTFLTITTTNELQPSPPPTETQPMTQTKTESTDKIIISILSTILVLTLIFLVILFYFRDILRNRFNSTKLSLHSDPYSSPPDSNAASASASAKSSRALLPSLQPRSQALYPTDHEPHEKNEGSDSYPPVSGTRIHKTKITQPRSLKSTEGYEEIPTSINSITDTITDQDEDEDEDCRPTSVSKSASKFTSASRCRPRTRTKIKRSLRNSPDTINRPSNSIADIDTDNEGDLADKIGIIHTDRSRRRRGRDKESQMSAQVPQLQRAHIIQQQKRREFPGVDNSGCGHCPTRTRGKP